MPEGIIPNEELLQKATLTTGDFGGGGQAPLSIEAAQSFIETMYMDQAILGDVRTVTSNASKWQEAAFDFANRIARPGTQATRLVDADRVKPATRMVEISTVLIKGEVPVSDEVFEDNIVGARFGQELESQIATRFGLDVEELLLMGDTAIGAGDPYLDLLDGWIKQAQGAGGNILNAAADGQDYQAIMGKLLLSLPERYKRSIEADGRFYVPKRLEEKFRMQLADRGTPLGDLMLTERRSVKYQGIEIRGVPNMTIAAGTPDTGYVLLTNRNNLYAGFRRNITIEKFRDPREGATSFIITARVDAKIGLVNATAIATNVDVEP